MFLPISQIRTDGGTQPRSALKNDVIEAYSESMAEGARFPPIDVFYDGTDYWLADGFHRVNAAYGAEFESIDCTVHQGTLEDAQWFSIGANKTNGLYRSNEDKQRAVQSALRHPKASGMSLREIAKHVGVSHEAVRTQRERMQPICQSLTDKTRVVRRGDTEYQQNTENIGRKPKTETRSPEKAIRTALEEIRSSSEHCPDCENRY